MKIDFHESSEYQKNDQLKIVLGFWDVEKPCAIPITFGFALSQILKPRCNRNCIWYFNISKIVSGIFSFWLFLYSDAL